MDARSPVIIENIASEIGDLYQRAKRGMVDGVLCLVRAGELLRSEKAGRAHGEWLPWIEANEDVLGFGERTARKLMGAYKIVASNRTLTSDTHDNAGIPPQHNLTEEEATHICRLVWGNASKDSQLVQQSLSNEHYTPEQYIKAARHVLGGIDLDPASCAEANKIVGATEFWDHEGETRDWHGRVWLNPPYGELVGTFIDKLNLEWMSQNIEAAIVLVNAHCTDTRWFQPLWKGILCFTDHRINFYGDDKRSGSTHGSVFAYFGQRRKLFAKQFNQFGAVVEAVK